MEPMDIHAETNRFFDDSSISTDEQPQAVIITGGVAAGKTRIRREKYPRGYVVLDAGEIFLNLCQGQHQDFPGELEEQMERVGNNVARRIFRERRHFVTEIIGADYAAVKQLIDVILRAGYKADVIHVDCDPTVARDRATKRANALNSDLELEKGEISDFVSGYYTEPFHQGWILANARPAANSGWSWSGTASAPGGGKSTRH